MIACSFLSPLHALPFLSIKSLQKGGPSVPGSLFNSAFMGCLLSACNTLCHGSGDSRVQRKGSEQSTDGVGSQWIRFCHPFLEAYPALDTLHPRSYNMHVCVHAQLCPTVCNPMDLACQGSLSMGFSRQGFWSGLLFPSPGNLPGPGIKPEPPALTAGFVTTEPPGKL